MDINLIRIVVTLLCFIAFLWIVLWAFRPSRRELQEMRAASILEDRDA